MYLCLIKKLGGKWFVNYISINFFWMMKGCIASEKLCGWDRQRGLAVAMSVGRGTDGYTEFWRNCLCGANCNTFKPCLLENLRWKRYITLQGFLAFWCFLWMRLQAGSGPCGASRFIQVTIKSVGHIQLSNIKPNHMCLSRIFWIMIWILKWL